jgi:transcriptional regulator with XRE-family HTH domain
MSAEPTFSVKRIVGTADPFDRVIRHIVGMANRESPGALIKALRKSKGLTQVEAAEAIGIGRSTLAGIERGLDMPGRETMIAIADFFEMPLDYFRQGIAGPVSPNGPEFAKDADELALLNFWRGLSPEQRKVVIRLLQLPHPRKPARKSAA